MNEVAPVADHQVIQEVNEGIVYDFDGLEPLCQALEEEDWETASRYVRNNQTAIEQIFRAKDLKNEIEFLCTAALSEEQWVLVEEIAKLAPPEALELVYTATGFTLLHLAAMYGNIKIVKALVNKNPRLTQIRSSTGMGTEMVPLTYAAVSASDEQKEIMEYLYPITRDDEPSPFSGDAGGELINALIEANSYGMFPDLVKHMVSEAKCEYPLLQMIVDRPIAFYSSANLTWWERCIYPLIEVNMDCPHDSGTPKQKDKLWARSSKGTKKDEENPAVTSKDSAISEDKSTGYTGSMTGNISVNLMRYLMTVPPIKHLCNKKLLHKQAVALVNIGLTCLDETMDEAQQVTYFSNSSIMSTAIKYGTTEFVMECLRMFPFLLYHRDLNLKMSLKISKMIIEERNVKLFNYICTLNEKMKRDRVTVTDENKNSILHYAAALAPNRQLNSVSGAAFQMQRELQWFKGVEIIVLPKDRFSRNEEGHTAQYLFTENHRDLMEKGEKWMKDTSGSCMLVGALIATVAFAAAFTVPGGNVSDNSSSNNGLPVFLNKKSFMVFAITDALALFSSITSVLMFLAVYTSPYSEEDFLKSLPQKMIIGLGTLFISMATILVTFGAAFTIFLGKRFPWAPIAVAIFGCVPVLLFGFLQFPLFVGMVRSTFWPIVFWKPKLPNTKRDIENKKED
ncbi:hypothetical protein MKX03_002687 [Papaver bracteatum]|nr:hypothetical protein MKX03_002687 [Papaver bracteatum]